MLLAARRRDSGFGAVRRRGVAGGCGHLNRRSRLERPSLRRLHEQRAGSLAGNSLHRIALSSRHPGVWAHVQDAGQGTVRTEVRPARHGGQRGLDPCPFGGGSSVEDDPQFGPGGQAYGVADGIVEGDRKRDRLRRVYRRHHDGEHDITAVAEGLRPGLVQALGRRVAHLGGFEVRRSRDIEGGRHTGIPGVAPIGDEMRVQPDLDSGQEECRGRSAGGIRGARSPCLDETGRGMGAGNPGRGFCRPAMAGRGQDPAKHEDAGEGPGSSNGPAAARLYRRIATIMHHDDRHRMVEGLWPAWSGQIGCRGTRRSSAPVSPGLRLSRDRA